MTHARTPTAVDTAADAYLDAWLAHDPIVATGMGVAGYDDQLPSLDPDWLATGSELRRDVVRELARIPATDTNDRITVAALTDEVDAVEAVRATGAEESDVKNIGSPVQLVRDVFDLMPTASVDNWAVIARRLTQVPMAITGYTASLRLAASRGDVRARRQIEAAIRHSEDNVGTDGFFELNTSYNQTRTSAGFSIANATKRALTASTVSESALLGAALACSAPAMGPPNTARYS